MENQSYEYRNWGELIGDALVLIITKLTLRDKLHSIPIVCKPWYKVITSSPDCWLDIDFDELFDDVHFQHIQVISVRMRLLQLLPILLRRCSSKFHSFSCSKYLNASSLSLLANSGTESLRTLKMPWTDLSNDETIFESVARKLSNLTYLDISHCSGIGVEGYHCKNLERLDMNSLRCFYNGESWAVRVGIPSEVAFAIASTMPKLKHLEISSMQLGNEDLLKILNSCAQLQYLDISECSFLKDVEILLKNFSALKVVPPFNDDYDYYSDFDKVYGYNDFEESYDYLFQ